MLHILGIVALVIVALVVLGAIGFFVLISGSQDPFP